MATASNILSTASREIGYSRWNDPNSGTKYGRDYATRHGEYFGASGVPYCAMFVTWVLRQNGMIPPGGDFAYVPSGINAARSQGRLVSIRSARPGDLVCYDWDHDGESDHVGIVELNRGSYIQTIEGNTSSGASGSQGNGGGVYRRTRGWESVSAVIRPAYSGTPAPSIPNTEKASQIASQTLEVDGWWGFGTTSKFQSLLKLPVVDGVISGQVRILNNKNLASVTWTGTGSELIKEIQRRFGLKVDGILGPNTIKSLQIALGTTPDGIISEESLMVMALQKKLNANDISWLKHKSSSSSSSSKPSSKKVRVKVDGYWGTEFNRGLQTVFNTTRDGKISSQPISNKKYLDTAQIGWEFVSDASADGSELITEIQKWLGVTPDGFFGPASIKALQKKMGTPVDGSLSAASLCVMEFQRRVNEGKIK